MAEQHATDVVSDEQILQEIRDFIRAYDPLTASDEYLRFYVLNGVVRVQGYVQGKRQYQVLMNHLRNIPGVMGVDDQHLHDDDTLLLKVAEKLPMGVRARVNFGVVTLMGRTPTNISPADVIMDVSEVPGVGTVRSLIEA